MTYYRNSKWRVLTIVNDGASCQSARCRAANRRTSERARRPNSRERPPGVTRSTCAERSSSLLDAAAAGGVVFHVAGGLDANAIVQVQAQVRRRLLRVFVCRGLLPGDDAQVMAHWQHGGGFSLDASVRIEAADRAGRERLLRYCARPPFALDRLRELDPERLLHAGAKPGPGGNAPLLLTPLELDRFAALVPPPRIHRHRYFGAPARTTAHG